MATRSGLIMVSGGMDSTVLAYWLASNSVDCLPVCFDYGQHCFVTECSGAARLLPSSIRGKVSTISLRGIYDGSGSLLIRKADLWRDSVAKEDLPLPYRNALLLLAACAAASTRGLTDVYSAFINSNAADELDATMSFTDTMIDFGAAVGGVRLHMPFRDLSKAQVARLGHELKVPIRQTFSCQVNSKYHCGSCPNCVDRLTALREMWNVDLPILPRPN